MSNLLENETIYLRALEPADVEVLYRWENDTSIWRVSNTQIPFSKHTLKQYIDSVSDIYASRQLRLMICTQKEGQPIGCIDLFDFDPNHLRAGIGILIGDKPSRKQGYASSAVSLMLRYASVSLGLHQLFCNILTSNEDSIALFSKQGFEPIGTKKEWIRGETAWEDETMFQRILNQP